MARLARVFRCSDPLLVVLIALGAQLAVADASPVLEEVVVTAQRREQGLIEVPISISVIDAQFIQDRNLLNITEVAQYAPNVSVTEQVLGFNVVSMRGFSSGANRGFEQSVGRYVDSVFSGRGAANSNDLNDIERVEILRGPQGTLFGNNTIAGTFNIVTKPANPDVWEGNGVLSLGSYNHRLLTGTVSGPIAKTLSIRVSLGHRQQDGHMENLAYTLGEADHYMGKAEKNLWRGKLDWHPNDRLSLIFASSGQRAESNMGYGAEMYLSRPPEDLQVSVGPLSQQALPVLQDLVPNIDFDISNRT